MRVSGIAALLLLVAALVDVAAAAPRARRGVAAERAKIAAAQASRPLRIAPAKRSMLQRKAAHQRPKYRNAGRVRTIRTPAPAAEAADAFGLTATQRGIIYRAIVRQPLQPKAVTTEPVATPPKASPTTGGPAEPPLRPPASAAEIIVGEPLPASVPLLDLPEDAVVLVPKVEGLRYAFVGDRVVLVEPDTGKVVAEIRQ